MKSPAACWVFGGSLFLGLNAAAIAGPARVSPERIEPPVVGEDGARSAAEALASSSAWTSQVEWFEPMDVPFQRITPQWPRPRESAPSALQTSAAVPLPPALLPATATLVVAVGVCLRQHRRA